MRRRKARRVFLSLRRLGRLYRRAGSFRSINSILALTHGKPAAMLPSRRSEALLRLEVIIAEIMRSVDGPCAITSNAYLVVCQTTISFSPIPLASTPSKSPSVTWVNFHLETSLPSSTSFWILTIT